jgi:hypothetical protein
MDNISRTAKGFTVEDRGFVSNLGSALISGKSVNLIDRLRLILVATPAASAKVLGSPMGTG